MHYYVLGGNGSVYSFAVDLPIQLDFVDEAGSENPVDRRIGELGRSNLAKALLRSLLKLICNHLQMAVYQQGQTTNHPGYALSSKHFGGTDKSECARKSISCQYNARMKVRAVSIRQ